MTCHSCGAENPTGQRFCGSCGGPLSAEPTTMREERKVVTVLFCDLAGFTAASESADPEDVRAHLVPYQRMLRDEIERHGGTVDKFSGDGVMAVFGAPAAHEDDAERAVRSALRILDRIDHLNERDHTFGLPVRIGINTGEAIVALDVRPEAGEDWVAGDVVNTAARLQGIAPIGGIVVGERTYRLTHDEIDYEPRSPVAVKGKSRAVLSWRVVGTRARFGTDRIEVAFTPFVGRERETALLRATFDRALADPSVQLVTIVGEPGIGKSRLVAELFHMIEERTDLVRWRQGRCLPYGEGITFWALGEIVKAHCGILESDSGDEAASKLARTLARLSVDASERAWVSARLSPLVGLISDAGDDAAQEESFAAWRTFLERIAEREPFVLVVEDIHWADPALLAFITQIAERSFGIPLVVLVTARPELYDREPSWAGGLRNATTISLAPLSGAETGELVSALLEGTLLPDEVRSALVERSGGNPLFAEQFVRLLAERGVLVREEREWVMVHDRDIPTPEGILALVAARLDALPADRKALLSDASVVGKVFWSSAVASMAGLSVKAVDGALRDLVPRELVRPTRSSSMAGTAEYTFWHALVADVAYAEIPRAERAAKHLAAAVWIEETAAERLEDHAEILAHHYSTALDLAVEVGRDDLVDQARPRALTYLILAGDRALELDVPVAEARYSAALTFTPAGDPQRAHVLVRWADAARRLGRFAQAVSALEEALADFERTRDVLAAARSMDLLSNVLWQQAEGQRSREVATQAVTLLESQPPSAELVAAYAGESAGHYLDGEFTDAIRFADRAIALAASIGLEDPVTALHFRGFARREMGDAGGMDDVRRALELGIVRGQSMAVLPIYNNLALQSWLDEGPQSAVDTLMDGVRFAERRGLGTELHAVQLCGPLHDLGRWHEVLTKAEELSESVEATGSSVALSNLRKYQARVFALIGECRKALPLAEFALDVARDMGSVDWIMPAVSVTALARLGTDDRSGAVDLLSGLARTPKFRETASAAWFLAEMIRTATGAGDVALAERLAGGFEPISAYMGHALFVAHPIVAEAKGEFEPAARDYAEAADRWERFGVVPERAFALLGLGRCRLELGHRGVTDTLQEARAIFKALGARPSLDETDALLERATALSS